MSLSFRNRIALAVIAGACAHAASAQTYFVPRVEVSSEYHTNRELTPVEANEDPTTGYIATVQALMGKRTERSQTELRPRVRFQEYPDRSGIDPVDAFLDLETQYATLKGGYQLLLSASRQDLLNAEFGEAGTDTGGPQTPPSQNDSGIVFIGGTRSELNAEPSFEIGLSERMKFGATLGYDKVDYNNSALAARTREDYTNYSVATMLTRQLRPLTEIAVGPYVSRFESAQGDNHTDGTGITVDWNHDVSEVSHTKINVQAERTKIEDPAIAGGSESQTNWGAEFSGWHKREVSRFDYALGRYLTASGVGSKMRRTELRLQYARQMSKRMGLKLALRGGNEQRIGAEDDSRDRNYARTEFSLRYLITPTVYVSGGYRYAWQKFKDLDNKSDDNVAYLLFGYHGLDIRRSAARGKR